MIKMIDCIKIGKMTIWAIFSFYIIPIYCQVSINRPNCLIPAGNAFICAGEIIPNEDSDCDFFLKTLILGDDIITFQICKEEGKANGSDVYLGFKKALEFIRNKLAYAEEKNFHHIEFSLSKRIYQNGWKISITYRLSDEKLPFDREGPINDMSQDHHLNLMVLLESGNHEYPPGRYVMKFTYGNENEFKEKLEKSDIQMFPPADYKWKDYYKEQDDLESNLTKYEFYPEALYNVLRFKVLPVDKDFKPRVKPPNDDYNPENKFQKFTATTYDWGFGKSIGESDLSKLTKLGSVISKIKPGIALGASSGTLLLTGYDSNGNPKESVEVIFTSFSLGVGISSPIQDILLPADKLKEYSSKFMKFLESKGLSEKARKFAGDFVEKFLFELFKGVNASADVPNFSELEKLFGKDEFIETNYPMALEDFIGWGWTANVVVPGGFEIKQTSFEFLEPNDHGNIRFEYLSVPNFYKTLSRIPNTVVYPGLNVSLEASYKYGFFQPEMSTHKILK